MAEVATQFAKAAAIGVAGGAADLLATSGWMHRELTHGSWTAPQAVELAARTILWQGTGIKPRVWGAVHLLDHHEYADEPGDPHSPVVESDNGRRNGMLRVLLANPLLYRRRAKQYESGEVPLPPQFQPDELDRKIFDKTKYGLAANLAGHVAMNHLVGNPAYMAPVSFGVEKAVYIAGGNLVNAIGHGGKHPILALLTGKIEPQDDDGTFGANSELVGALTFGEGYQWNHHRKPTDVQFGTHDILGATILTLAKHGHLAPVPQMQPKEPQTA